MNMLNICINVYKSSTTNNSFSGDLRSGYSCSSINKYGSILNDLFGGSLLQSVLLQYAHVVLVECAVLGQLLIERRLLVLDALDECDLFAEFV